LDAKGGQSSVRFDKIPAKACDINCRGRQEAPGFAQDEYSRIKNLKKPAATAPAGAARGSTLEVHETGVRSCSLNRQSPVPAEAFVAEALTRLGLPSDATTVAVG
jgi:hypothetical protein